MTTKLFQVFKRNVYNNFQLNVKIYRAISPKGLEGPSARYGTKKGSFILWRIFACYFTFPILAFHTFTLYRLKKKEKQPKFVPYEYMRIRTKRFPWGDGERSLFHNPEKNALPSGYENGN